jgi:putative RNA 2'-phosphotransferase
MAYGRDVHISKLLSLVLRHKPETLGLVLDGEGYVDVAELLAACARHGQSLTRADLERVVRDNDKQRFAFSADGARLRASQGHSVPVSLGYTPSPPPELLYHGTVSRFVAAIRKEGLKPGERQLVHLSANEETARTVGARRGRPVILRVRAAAMAQEGFEFFISANGVWLTRAVLPRFLVFPDALQKM